MPATIDDPERQASAREEASRLWHSVARLPFVQQVLLHLAHSEALSHGEVARRMCQPLGTVKTRLRDAHARLRDQRLAIQSFNALRSAKQ